MSVELKQNAKIPTEKTIDKAGHWIMLLPEKPSRSLWQGVPYGRLIRQFRDRLDKPALDDVAVLDLPNPNHSRLSLACVKPGISAFELLGLARKLVAAHQKFNPRVVSITVPGFAGDQADRLIEAVISAALAANADLPSYKKERPASRLLEQIEVHGYSRKDGFKQTFAIDAGNTLARRLSMLPPNKLQPTEYRREVRKLARANKWKYRFYGIDELKKRKAGAFLAVCQGSPVADAGIVRLSYQPRRAAGRQLALVGKGICYDTGGTNLKPAKYMFGMHEDMQGSAVALGTLLALTKLKVSFRIDCWLALAMNHIGPRAYKPNDVVTASDGTSIEIVHTDAEGRMVLADTLLFATQEKPGLVMDYATLTGACVYSLGTSYSGVFSNRAEVLDTLIQSGRDSGERVWPFPLDEDYDEAIKSDIADVRQCAVEGNADHILASRFLQRFVKHDTPWVHVDLASSNRKGGLAHIPTDTTGFGIRFSLDLLLDKKILKKVK
ncbi:MAG: leucyl aminopeptidase family protein [Thiotrichales bacterium]|nr:leucyl aminopeptidase family protein [Thiotrichales bacterium]